MLEPLEHVANENPQHAGSLQLKRARRDPSGLCPYAGVRGNPALSTARMSDGGRAALHAPMTITNPEARRRAADEAFARASGRLAGEAELMLLLAKIPATVPADELAESFDRALVGEARPAVLIEPPPPPARLPRLRAPRALRPLVRRVPLAWRLAVRGGLRRVIGFRPALRRRPQPAAAPPPTPPADDLLPATHGTPPSEWCAATGPRVTIVIVNWDAADLTRVVRRDGVGAHRRRFVRHRDR